MMRSFVGRVDYYSPTGWNRTRTARLMRLESDLPARRDGAKISSQVHESCTARSREESE